jgi:hypothetical protein
MIRRIAGLANRRSWAMLLRFEAVWAHMRPLVWTGCCSPCPFLAALSRETPVELGAVTAPAFRYSVGATAPTPVFTGAR